MYKKTLKITLAIVICSTFQALNACDAPDKSTTCATAPTQTPAQDSAEILAHSIALFAAAQQGDLTKVQKHLAAGANIDYQDMENDGETPLIEAATRGHLEAVQLLLAHGANPRLQDKIPMPYGLFGQWTALYYAALQGHTSIVQCLLDAAPDTVDLADPACGTTPLIEAAIRDHLETVQLLLARGANPRLQSKCPLPDGSFKQCTALYYAAQQGYSSIVQCLSDAAPDTVDLADPQRNATPLMEAAYAGHLETVQLLLARGANPKSRDKIPLQNESPRQWTALCVAAAEKNVFVMAELASKAMLDEQDRCPICLSTGKDITQDQLRITACCMKPFCEDCAQSVRTSETGDKCPLCTTQPLFTVKVPEQEPEMRLHMHV